MAKVSDETLLSTCQRYEANGFDSAATARDLGCSQRKVQRHIEEAKHRGLYQELVQQPPIIQTPIKPIVRIRAFTHETPPEGPIIRVLGIGDAHDSPDIPGKSRFKWIGKHIAETNPDYVVDIGDSCTFDSLCSYVGNETYEGKLKPSIQDDLSSYRKAMETLFDQVPNWKGKFEKTRGNHEDRIWSFENRNPEIIGMVKGEYRRIIEDFKINETPYGEFRFLGGVGFIHTPMTMMSKPYGGKTMQPIANDATFDIVFGHTHKQGVLRVPKIGPQNYVKIINLGCALPWGHIEGYARIATQGWWWGCVELVIQGGHVISESFIPMIELERRYG